MEANLNLLSNEKPPVYKAKRGYLSQKKREGLRYNQKVNFSKSKRTNSNKPKENLKNDSSNKAIHDAVKQIKNKIIQKEASHLISKGKSSAPNNNDNSRQTSFNDTFTDQTFDYGFSDSSNFSKIIGQESRGSSHRKSRQNGSSRYFDSILKRFQKPSSTIKVQNKHFGKKLSCFSEKIDQKLVETNFEMKPLKFTDDLKHNLVVKSNKNGLKFTVNVFQKQNIKFNSKSNFIENSFSKIAHQDTLKKQK